MSAKQEALFVHEPYSPQGDSAQEQQAADEPRVVVRASGIDRMRLHHFEDAHRLGMAHLAEDWTDLWGRLRRAAPKAMLGSMATMLSFGCTNVAAVMTEPDVPAALYSVGNADCHTSSFAVLHVSGTGKHTSQHMEYLNREFIERNGGASWDYWYGTKWNPDEVHEMIDAKAKACNRSDKLPLYINTMSLGGKLMQQVINEGDFTHAEVRGLIMSAGAPTAEEVQNFWAWAGVGLAASTDKPVMMPGWPSVMLGAISTELARNGLWHTLVSPAAHKSISDSVAETNTNITGWQVRQNGLPLETVYVPQAGTQREMEYYFVGSKYDKVVDNERAVDKWRQLTNRPIHDFWIEKEERVNDSDNHADDWVAARRDPRRKLPRYDTNQELNYNEVYARIYAKVAVQLAFERQMKHQRSGNGARAV